ncbi:MAG: NAD-dependent deacylase [Armatimonadetes bacterium]|nr:NAD-dependent deacylase [Armatimonadota bacterium]
MEPEERLVEWLGEARRVLAFCGAGVSAESGVPTFRGTDGLWEGHSLEDVATPAGFGRDPLLVWRFYAERRLALLQAVPNPAHRALAAMEQHYPWFLLVTQNVDDLHERAGSQDPLHLHGTLTRVRCSACRHHEEFTAELGRGVLASGAVPRCRCGALLRPDVVWFGELLDPGHVRRIERFLEAGWQDGPAFLVLVIGTSGVVSGGYGIHTLPASLGARVVEINPEATLISHEVDLAVRAPAGSLLGRVWPRVASQGIGRN